MKLQNKFQVVVKQILNGPYLAEVCYVVEETAEYKVRAWKHKSWTMRMYAI